MQCSLDRLIAPSFYKVHNSIEDYTHFWLCGGRGSTKSSFVSVEIILGIMKNADTNAVVLRKVGAYLKDSVFSQLEWAIEKLGVSDMWDIKVCRKWSTKKQVRKYCFAVRTRCRN